MDQPAYLVISYYWFHEFKDPRAEVAIQKSMIETLDITSRIYVSESGVNAQMSGTEKDAEIYTKWLLSREEYNGVQFKIQKWHEHAFPGKCVKYRKNLVAYDEVVDLNNRGEHLPPEKWKEMLEQDDKHLLIDVRNDYEWKVGHFEGAELPACKTFREFKEYADNLKESVDPKTTPVMMYCTGGIRCELYSAILKNKGFEKVYQLDGGVINYGQKVGQSHWLGKLFVFDDRLVVPIDDKEPSTIVGSCHRCETACDDYYNCANMDCNELFICCKECLKTLQGCCKEECSNAPRLRPYHDQNAHKPFRKWYHYYKNKQPVS